MAFGWGAYLDEPNILGLLSEALSADIEAVFSDQTGSVRADAAFGWVHEKRPGQHMFDGSGQVEAIQKLTVTHAFCAKRILGLDCSPVGAVGWGGGRGFGE